MVDQLLDDRLDVYRRQGDSEQCPKSRGRQSAKSPVRPGNLEIMAEAKELIIFNLVENGTADGLAWTIPPSQDVAQLRAALDWFASEIVDLDRHYMSVKSDVTASKHITPVGAMLGGVTGIEIDFARWLERDLQIVERADIMALRVAHRQDRRRVLKLLIAEP